MELKTNFVPSAFCGGFGAILLNHDCLKYVLVRFLGGIIGSLGTLFTICMIMQTLPPINGVIFHFSSSSNSRHYAQFNCTLLVKIVLDKWCWVTGQQDFKDDFSSLTKMIIEK